MRLNQAQGCEITQEPADNDGRDAHANEEHDIEESDDTWPCFIRRTVGRKRQARRLCHVHADTSHNECECRKAG